MDRGVPIRAVSRGLAALKTISRNGPLSMMEIANAVDVPYPTACRIVQTLMYEGYVERESYQKKYRTTALVHALSSGYQIGDDFTKLARPIIEELTRKVQWPVAIARRVGLTMMIQDSTHTLSPLTFDHYYAGFTLPIFSSSSGIVYLAYSGGEERQNIIKGLKDVGGDMEKYIAYFTESSDLIKTVRSKGYATHSRNQFTNSPGKTSSIAVPIVVNEDIVFSLALIFFASAMTIEQAAEQYLEDLQDAAFKIVETVKHNPNELIKA